MSDPGSELQRNYQAQAAIGAMLEFALQPLSLTEQLQRCLDLLLELPWLALDQQGCIFLLDQQRGRLRMTAQRGLPADLLAGCREVELGSCLCGRAAESGETLFRDCVDATHERRGAEMPPHGHYCVPINSSERVLGVITLYVRDQHVQQPFEENFLKAAANTLSGLIERRRAEEELQLAKQQLELLLDQRTSSLERLRSERALILDAIGDAVCGIDLKGAITFVNPAGAKQTGYRAEDLVGRDFHNTLHHSRADETPNPRGDCPICASCSREGPHRSSNALLWRKDGSSFPAEYVATPLRGDDELLGAVIAFRDISERLRVEQQKEEFVLTVSHELRTPLTSIRGSLGLLESGSVGTLTEGAKQMVEIARTSSDRLIRLVNGVLDLEKIEAGQAQLAAHEVRAPEIIDLTLEIVAEIAREGAVQLTSAAPASLPLLRGERDRLVQVLTNLVANAISYSPSGGTVHISCQGQDADGVRFEVRDEGPGIPHEAQGQLFNKFQQVGPDDARRRSGSGLGLAISRAIVELHGGTIGVQSDPGQGATFFFTIPTH